MLQTRAAGSPGGAQAVLAASAARRQARGRTGAQVAGAAISGVLVLAAFPPYGIWPLAPVGVALLLLTVRGCRVGTGAALGLVHGLAFFVPLLQWSGIYVGPVPWLLLAASQAAFLAVLGAALAAVSRGPAWPLAAACLWVAQEAARMRLPWGGFPWGRLGFASADAPWVPLAALGGVPLVSFAVALVGGLLAAAVLALAASRPGRAAGLAGAGALGCALAGLLVPLLPPLGSPAAGAREAVVAVIQGNVPRAGLDFNAQREQVLRNHVARTRELAARVRAGELPRPELVIWPENGSDLDPFTDSSAYVLIDDAVRDIGVPVLVGAILDGPGREVSNAGIVWDPVTGPGERYLKRHPVPFAEYIPLRPIARRVSSAVELRQRDTFAGSEPGILAMAGTTVGDVICFEVAYDGLVRDVVTGGAGLLAVQTNNATFGYTPETEQQLVMSQLRAVEHGRSTVVAATSGVSAIISDRGEVLHRAELFAPAVLVERVPLADARTLATRSGVLVEALLVAGGALALAARRPGRRPRSAPGGPTR